MMFGGSGSQLGADTIGGRRDCVRLTKAKATSKPAITKDQRSIRFAIGAAAIVYPAEV